MKNIMFLQRTASAALLTALLAPVAAAAAPTVPLAPVPALQPLAPLPAIRPEIPPPGVGSTNLALRNTFQSVNQALTVNPALGEAARFDYYEALERYRSGDFLGARNAASRAQAIAGSAGFASPIAPLQPLTPNVNPIVPPNPFQGPQGSYLHPSTTAPANPLLAEDPTDATLALVRRDIDIAKHHTSTVPAEAAYDQALAKRRAGDEKAAAAAADHALDLVRSEMTR